MIFQVFVRCGDGLGGLLVPPALLVRARAMLHARCSMLYFITDESLEAFGCARNLLGKKVRGMDHEEVEKVQKGR